MAASGIFLLGHLGAIRDATLIYALDLEENLAKGDEWFTDFKKSVDEYVTKNALDVPDSQPDEDIAESKEVSRPTLELNLTAAGIESIIWASGFRYDFGWVKLPVFDETGAPIHCRGVTTYAGIYFLGLKWLYKMKSAFLSIAGPAEDAAYLAELIKAGRKQG